MIQYKNILLIRNDKLGDFMLAWPALSLLKHQYPNTLISVLIPAYTKPMAELCPWIDNIIIDDQHQGTIKDAKYLSEKFRHYNFDLSISLFLQPRTTLALWLAHIPQRIGPATKPAQLFLNKRLRQRRSLSLKPEYEYNADLVRYFISIDGQQAVTMPQVPYLQFDHEEITKLRQTYITKNKIDKNTKLIFIHSGNGGSAVNLSTHQFAELAHHINKKQAVHFIITAGPDEKDTAIELSNQLKTIDHSIYHSTNGLVNFSKFISICDLFISGSTGPLHIAGALNVNTAAFYPARRSATALRWQTINEGNKRISFSPEKYTDEQDMVLMDMKSCAAKISNFLKTH